MLLVQAVRGRLSLKTGGQHYKTIQFADDFQIDNYYKKSLRNILLQGYFIRLGSAGKPGYFKAFKSKFALASRLLMCSFLINSFLVNSYLMSSYLMSSYLADSPQ